MLEILRRFDLPGVPSASGIEKVKHQFWFMGDNSPFIYVCEDDFTHFRSFQLHDFERLEDGVIPKKKKRDLEAMFSLLIDEQAHLFLLGSGSKKKRMKGYTFTCNDPMNVKDFDLEALYEAFMRKSDLSEDELNIEAATVLDDQLYLFNRKRNIIFSVEVNDFLNYFEDEKQLPKFEIFQFTLPELDGFEAGFSGATTDEVNQRIIFTASVEQTDSTYLDGETSGSFVGILTKENLENGRITYCEPITKDHLPIKIKVESIAIDKIDGKVLNCLLVTDSDGGISELLEVKIN